MPDWLLLVVVALAAYRLWHLAARDSILDRPRDWLVGSHPAVADFVDCPWCLGLWLSAGVIILETYVVDAPTVWAVLAVSAVVGLIGERS